MKNPFDKTDRGLRHYETLKNDLDNNSENILISLPLFIRIIYTDKASPWYDEFNKFDLINPIFVHPRLSELSNVEEGVKVCLNIKPTQMEIKYISASDFLSAPIIHYNKRLFTIQDFISSVAYNRGLHNESDRNELNNLYLNFIVKFHEITFSMISEIAYCFVRSFDSVYEKFMGDNNGFSPENHHQPKIMENGKFFWTTQAIQWHNI